jgi:hypothetical protein
LEEFASLVVAPHSRTWVPALFNGERSNESWQSQQVFALDFDGGISLEKVLSRLGEFGLSCNLIYSTFSSSPTSPKFRVVFVLQEMITDKALRDEIMDALLVLFNEADRSCHDAARMFFGGRDLIYQNFGYRLNPVSLMTASDVFFLVGYQKTQKPTDSKNWEKKADLLILL